MTVLFVALGSRGDVLPVLAVAKFLTQRGVRCEVVTHSDRADARALVGGDVVYHLLRMPSRALPPELSQRGEVECGWGEGEREEAQEQVVSIAAKASNLQGIAFNLFFLEAWSIAEYLKVPAVALSPFLPQRQPPPRFERMLQAECPDLCRALDTAGEGEVGWDEVRLWMWRMFVDDFGEFRGVRLGLPPLPLSVPLPRPTPLVLLLPTAFAARVRLPPSVTVSGLWKVPVGGELPSRVVAALERCRGAHGGLVLAAFGAPASLGLVDTAEWEMLLEGVGLGVVWHDPEGSDEPQVVPAKRERGEDTATLLKLKGPVPHNLLAPHADVVVHHGGAGTSATFAAAGVPQVIVPFIFDQPMWGELLEHCGAAVQVSPSKLTPDSVKAAVSSALKLRDGAAALRDELSKDCDGIGTAAAVLTKAMHLNVSSSTSPTPRQSVT